MTAAMMEVFRAIEQVAPETCGAFVRTRDDGSMAGALLIEHGRICWAISDHHRRRLTDALISESGALTHAELNEVFAQCRRDRLPLGETLVARGLMPLPVLHRALLRHTCEALDSLLRDEASSWAWLEHSGRGYHPMLTFSPPEILAGVQAIAHPDDAGRAAARLRKVLQDGQRGFAVRARCGRMPLAQIRCEGEDLGVLADLATQVEQVLEVAATMETSLAVMQLDSLACAGWVEGSIIFVLLCDGELAFNRLLAQTATITTQT